jgi:hypothetical protein
MDSMKRGERGEGERVFRVYEGGRKREGGGCLDAHSRCDLGEANRAQHWVLTRACELTPCVWHARHVQRLGLLLLQRFGRQRRLPRHTRVQLARVPPSYTTPAQGRQRMCSAN